MCSVDPASLPPVLSFLESLIPAAATHAPHGAQYWDLWHRLLSTSRAAQGTPSCTDALCAVVVAHLAPPEPPKDTMSPGGTVGRMPPGGGAPSPVEAALVLGPLRLLSTQVGDPRAHPHADRLAPPPGLVTGGSCAQRRQHNRMRQTHASRTHHAAASTPIHAHLSQRSSFSRTTPAAPHPIGPLRLWPLIPLPTPPGDRPEPLPSAPTGWLRRFPSSTPPASSQPDTASRRRPSAMPQQLFLPRRQPVRPPALPRCCRPSPPLTRAALPPTRRHCRLPADAAGGASTPPRLPGATWSA